MQCGYPAPAEEVFTLIDLKEEDSGPVKDRRKAEHLLDEKRRETSRSLHRPHEKADVGFFWVTLYAKRTRGVARIC